MEKRAICILILATFIINIVPITGTSVNGTPEKTDLHPGAISQHPIEFTKTADIIPPIPGCMNGEFPLFQTNFANNDGINHETVATEFNKEIESILYQITELAILGYLENLTSFGPRVTSTPACENAGKYIYNEFRDMGLNVRYHNWSYRGEHGSNIEATIEGADTSSDKIFIICAHYDSVPGSPGADDDGSGTVAVLSAAEVMSKHSFNNTVRFVTFSGEEQGLFGSHLYAETAYYDDDNIIAVLNVDMIGFAESDYDATMVKVFDDDSSQWITDFTSSISQGYEFLNLEIIPSGFTRGSDHYSFWEFGYNAIFYFEYNFNDYYHSSEDTIEHMNIPYATNVTRLITATLIELSEFLSSNHPPDAPIITGHTNGNAGTDYEFIFTTIDPDEDYVHYYIEWGDGDIEEWIGAYASGEEVIINHMWPKQGTYTIKVKAKDSYDFESGWTTLEVSMPKNKATNTPFLDFLENHLHLFPLLQRLLWP